MQNLQHRECRERLLDAFKKNMTGRNCIQDDFLQEELITLYEHEEISSLKKGDRNAAAEILLECSEKYVFEKDVSEKDVSMARIKKVLSILRSYKIEMKAKDEKTGCFLL